MNASTLYGTVVLSTILLIAGNADSVLASSITPTEPNSMFSVTSLGSSYTLQQDSSGAVQTVTNGDGSQVYAFAKSPVIQVNKVIDEGGINSWYKSIIEFQVGSIQYGENIYQTPNRYWAVPFGTLVPTNNFDSGWSIGSVTDGNSKGQFIGSSEITGSASFSFPNGSLSNVGIIYPSYLSYFNIDQYIAQDLAIKLTTALKIDDNGDIIAYGTQNGINQYFLLTLNDSPTTAPEPSVLVTLGIGGMALCWIRRRSQMRS